MFPNAELVVNATEYNWWTDPSRLGKLPEGRKPAGKRIAENFPKWKNWKLVEDGAEVAPGVQLIAAPGHTPGHSVFLVASGNEQLLVSADTMYVPALLAPHPEWQGSYDQDGPTAIATRRKLIDRVIADNIRICGSHFPFPGTGTFVKDGNAYAFTPAAQSLNPNPNTKSEKDHDKTSWNCWRPSPSLRRRSAVMPLPAYAVDDMESTDAPDLTAVRAKIDAKDYQGALADLRDLAQDVQQADVYNLLGFTLRKTGDYETSAHLLQQGARAEAGPQGRPRISRRALCRDRPSRQGQGAAGVAAAALPERLRGARGPASGNQDPSETRGRRASACLPLCGWEPTMTPTPTRFDDCALPISPCWRADCCSH